MGNIGTVLRFGAQYLRRYQARLVAGILLGILFGLTTASFVWATKVMIGRMTPETPAAAVAATETNLPATNVVATGFISQLKSEAKVLKARVGRLKARAETGSDQFVDPWLPKMGRPIDWRQFLGGLLCLPILVALRGFCGYLSTYCLSWVSERVVNDLRCDVLAKLSGLSLDFFNRATMGDLLTRVNGDTSMLQRCLSLGVADLIQQPVTLIGLAAALCVMDPELTLLALLFVPLCVVPVIVLGRKVRKSTTQGWDKSISQSSLLVEILSGIRVVKAFGLENLQVRRFREISRGVLHFTLKTVRVREQINPIIETVSMLGLGLLILYIVHQQRRIDDIVGYLTGIILIYTPIKKIAGLHMLFQQTRIGVERLTGILSEQPTIKELPDAKPVTGFHGSIKFENVDFSYANAPVLRNITLEIPRGQKLGIAGESGSGKSTLLNLVFRFYDPTAGAIRMDGLDLRGARIDDLRKQMALVSQEIVLFNETVAENIAYGKPGATRGEIEAAARAASAHEFILQMPQGYDTPVGERGVTLSGGQRQRLAIARAFIRNAPLLVLDEATASLDSQAEAEVQAAINRLEENRTVICVAHRLSTLATMDRIIVLTSGRIVEQGTFSELLRQNGIFAAMARKQGIDSLA
jgi:subfamily B ATP-binding cassette protein MsbA